MQSKVHEKVVLTHFPDCQYDVALQREGNRLWVGPHIWLCRCAPEAGNLQSRGYWISTKLSVELQNGGISGRPRPKHLVVDSCHALGREPVLPSVNCPKVSCLPGTEHERPTGIIDRRFSLEWHLAVHMGSSERWWTPESETLNRDPWSDEIRVQGSKELTRLPRVVYIKFPECLTTPLSLGRIQFPTACVTVCGH
jgi:hypothetical protein